MYTCSHGALALCLAFMASSNSTDSTPSAMICLAARGGCGGACVHAALLRTHKLRAACASHGTTNTVLSNRRGPLSATLTDRTLVCSMLM